MGLNGILVEIHLVHEPCYVFDPAMTLGALQDAIRRASGTHALLCVLGRFAKNVGVPDGKDNTTRFKVIEAAKKVLNVPAPTSGCEVTQTQLQSLADAIDGLGKNDAALAAEAIFCACDETFRSALHLAFEAEERIELHAGDAFPIALNDLKQLYGDVKLTPRPSSRNSPYRERDYVDIFPGSRTHRVVFEFRHQLLLSRLIREKTLGLAFPNASAAEIDLSPQPEDGKFFDVAPRDLKRQAQTIASALDAADAHGAATMLLPELSVSRALSQAIGKDVRTRRQLSLVLAGSFHVREGVRGVNRMEIHSAFSLVPLTHDKLVPFKLKSWNGANYQPPLVEDIEPSDVITVNWSAGWSCVTLICKDFLSTDVRALLELLRPNFIFVVAFSDSTVGFEANAQAMASNCQATVVICNFVPQSTASPAATVVLPIEQAGRIVTVVQSAEGVQGKLVLFHLEAVDKPYDFQLIDVS